MPVLTRSAAAKLVANKDPEEDISQGTKRKAEEAFLEQLEVFKRRAAEATTVDSLDSVVVDIRDILKECVKKAGLEDECAFATTINKKLALILKHYPVEEKEELRRRHNRGPNSQVVMETMFSSMMKRAFAQEEPLPPDESSLSPLVQILRTAINETADHIWKDPEDFFGGKLMENYERLFTHDTMNLFLDFLGLEEVKIN